MPKFSRDNKDYSEDVGYLKIEPLTPNSLKNFDDRGESNSLECG
jgi:hypothetical protein